MKKSIIFSLAILLITVFLGFGIEKTHAVDIGAGNFKTTLGDPDVPYTNVDSAVTSIVNAIITISEIAFILLFLVGGIMYLTSTGNEEQAAKARKLIIDAIIGLIIVLAAWAISTWIIGKLTDGESDVGGSGNTSSTSIPTGGSGGTMTTALPTSNSDLPDPGVDINTGTGNGGGSGSSVYQQCMTDCYGQYQEDYSSCDVDSCRQEAEDDYNSCKTECASGSLSDI